MTTKKLTARYEAALAAAKASIEGRPAPTKARRAARVRVMYAVISEGRDCGAYPTREIAQAEADKLPDGYITETLRRA